MFKIMKNTIHCSRGDSGTITVKITFSDANGYIKYINNNTSIYYWVNPKNGKIYNTNYEEQTEISIDDLDIVFLNFEHGDVVKFNIYKKNGYGKPPVTSIFKEVDEQSQSVDINLTEDDTTFDEPVNKATTYWYDITLNEDTTIVGFTEEGPKEFIIYPAKGMNE